MATTPAGVAPLTLSVNLSAARKQHRLCSGATGPMHRGAAPGGVMKIYGDSISGNCLKVKWVADFLGLSYDWIETDIMVGESRTSDFLAMNPAGQVPALILDDGRPLAQSNA